MTGDGIGAGTGLPTADDFTANELAWIAFIRLIARDRDPAPSLAAIQALHMVLRHT